MVPREKRDVNACVALQQLRKPVCGPSQKDAAATRSLVGTGAPLKFQTLHIF
jgi:hypothetical protein